MRFAKTVLTVSLLAAAVLAAPAHAKTEKGAFQMTLPEDGPGHGRVLIHGSPYALLQEAAEEHDARDGTPKPAAVEETPAPKAAAPVVQPAPMTPAVKGLPFVPASVDGAPTLEQLQSTIVDKNRRGTPAPVFTTLGEAAAAGVDPLKERSPDKSAEAAPRADATTSAPAPKAASANPFGNFNWKDPKAYSALLDVVKADMRLQAGLGGLVALLLLWLLRRRKAK